MSDIAPEILEEVEDCVQRIKAYQESKGRRIHKWIKRSRKGRTEMAAMEQFGIPIADDFRALYHNYNGAKGGSMSRWEEAVFLDFKWSTVSLLVTGNKIMRLEKSDPLEGSLYVFDTTRGTTLLLDPRNEETGLAPLRISLGTLSRNSYIAFDSVLAMLRSVCAAQDADIIQYQTEQTKRRDSQGRVYQKNEAFCDVEALWQVIKPFNPSATYWEELIAGTMDWDRIEFESPGGYIELDPEIHRLVVGDPKKLYAEVEEEMRQAGMTEEEIIRARTVDRNT